VKKLIYVVLLVFAATMGWSISAQLPASLTQSERKVLQGYLQDQLQRQDFAGGTVPDGSFFAPAEYEKADAVLFAWAGYRSLLGNLIKATTDYGYKVVLVVEGSYDKSNASSYLRRIGVNMDKVSFLQAPLNSVWMRDYGPWFILDKNGDRAVVDLIYNRPRPQDDKIPQYVANALKVKRYAPRLVLPGGNLVVDGKGTAFMTDVVFDPSEGGSPDLTKKQLEKIFRDYFNCDRVVILKKMKRDGTGHLDMFGKLLPNNIFLIGEYARPEDGALDNYKTLNENAKKIAEMKDLLGNPYKVVRIPMPPYRNGISYTYTNSLIYNKLVLVPVYGFSTDEKALEIYRKCLPGYKVVGIDCSSIISANGAIHCISKLIMSPAIRVKLKDTDEGKIAIVNSNYPLRQAKLVVKDANGTFKMKNLNVERVQKQTLNLEDISNQNAYLYLKDIRGFEKIVHIR
jgi:agmatine deiminase